MIKKVFTALLVAGALLGASAMFPLMYNEPLNDFSIEGINNYTSLLYGLGPSIITSLFAVINNTFRPLIDLINNAVGITENIIEWLTTGLSRIISFFSGWWN